MKVAGADERRPILVSNQLRPTADVFRFDSVPRPPYVSFMLGQPGTTACLAAVRQLTRGSVLVNRSSAIPA